MPPGNNYNTITKMVKIRGYLRKKAFKKRRAQFAPLRAAKRARITTKKRSVVRNKRNVQFGEGLPKRATVTHKYSEYVGLTCTSGTVQNYNFSCNGMYDPNVSGTGHQPMYFDQFGALYDHYTVIGSKITVKATPLSANQGPGVVGILVNDDTTLSATGGLAGINEATLAKHRVMPLNVAVPVVLTHTWSAKKYFPGSTMANVNLQGTTAANPTEQSFFTIYYGTQDQLATASIMLEVDIEYIAVWSELKEIAQS